MSPEGPRLSADRLLGVALIVIAGLTLWSAQSLVVAFAADPLGPKGFPSAVATILAVCGALLLFGRGLPFAWPERRAAPFLLLVVMAAYALLLEPLGFLLATAGLALGVALLFGARLWMALLTSAATSAALWALFDKLLDLPLPKGILGA
ncbi:tripartite tricarboxylate transporter TctB family protein [Roseococcus pinisoli]|uniref:Tripartite tricarboxylate transporter TctB family protein n=1 Tax=Roseococcus pinisoli TaxID=2835040 RepID=A0ABS5QDB6_9PROT|nr:tripartite tricarboxylate transporter TctB family protein [Roseococcus pinisoli]